MGGNCAGRPGPLPPRPATPARMACSAVRSGIGRGKGKGRAGEQKKGGKKRHARQTGGTPTALMAVDLRGSEEQPEQVCSWNATQGGPPMDVDTENRLIETGGHTKFCIVDRFSRVCRRPGQLQTDNFIDLSINSIQSHLRQRNRV